MMKRNLYFYKIQSTYNCYFYNFINRFFTDYNSTNSSNEKKNISTNQIQANISRKELKKMIGEKDNIIKKQIKSSGPGGQHVNKTQSAVLLQDKKTNISVKVGNSRDSIVNSGIAKKRLIDKLDLHYNGADSKIAKKIEKIKKQKDRNRRKRENNYNPDKDPKH
jgi:protein subunit release factor B